MKQSHHTTCPGTATTPADVGRWVARLFCLHARLAPRFARPEPYRRVLLYLQGILSETERKNGWQLAEHAGEGRPDGMQRLLSQAIWDTEGVRDDLRAYVLEQLGTESAIVVIDETSFPKRGSKSAGVGMQYCGTTGRVENCQVGVFLSYVTAQGHTLIDRELYLPLDWCEDRERCHAAHIPDVVRFQTKPELAIQMLARLCDAGLPIAWVVADSVYGGNLDLRGFLEAHEYPYVLAVACDEPVGIVTPDGVRRRVEVREVATLVLQEHDWQRLSMSEGTKGPRLWRLWPWYPSCTSGRTMAAIGSSSAAAWAIPPRKPTTSSLRPKARRSRRWWRPSARAGRSKRISKTPKTWGWTITKCAASAGGTDTSRSSCWR